MGQMMDEKFNLNHKEETLSDKDFCWSCSGNLRNHERVIKTKDIKIFFAKLKIDFQKETCADEGYAKLFNDFVDKRIGEKLI